MNLRQLIPAGCEPIDESQEFKDLEVVGRGLAVRAALGTELSIEVGEELRCRSHPTACGSHLGCADASELEARASNRVVDLSKELGRDVVEIGDLAVQQPVLFTWWELFQLLSSPDSLIHVVTVPQGSGGAP